MRRTNVGRSRRAVTEPHLTEATLIRAAFSDTTVAPDTVPLHVAECAECRGIVDTLRTQANALRLASSMDDTQDCLDAESITAVAEGTIDSADAPAVFAHLLACA